MVNNVAQLESLDANKDEINNACAVHADGQIIYVFFNRRWCWRW